MQAVSLKFQKPGVFLFQPTSKRYIPRQSAPLSDASWDLLHQVDALLADADPGAGVPERDLRRLLNKVPKAQRGIDWIEREVKFYHKKRIKAQRAFVLVAKIRSHREKAGEVTKFDQFFDEIGSLCAPYVLTLHGFGLPFQQRDADAIASDIERLFDRLQSMGLCVFINAGTLLGAVREGGFLAHDDDADICVRIHGDTDRELVKNFIQVADQLNRSGQFSQPVMLSRRTPVIKVKLDSGVTADLFAFWIRGGKAYLWAHVFGELDENDIFPLGKERILGKEFPAPRVPEKMLALNYGTSWRIPDTQFRFPYDTAKRKFAAFLTEYKRARYWPDKWSKLKSTFVKK